MSAMVSEEVDAYLVAVAEALADLPPAERAELLDDVAAHLREVAAEEDGPLHLLLGPPDRYAAELRGAALPEAPAAPARAAALKRRITLGWKGFLRSRATRLTASAVRELRPAWWVLRGVLVVFYFHTRGDYDLWQVTHPSGVIWVAAVVAVVVSVAFGVWSRGRGGLWGRAALLLIAFVVVAPSVHQAHRAVEMTNVNVVYAQSAASPAPTPVGSLTQPDGLVQNIYPYDSQGHPLSGVQLFDQRGERLDIEVGQDANGNPLARRVPVSTTGSALENVFPQEQTVSTPNPDGSESTAAVVAPTPSVGALSTDAVAVVPPGPGTAQPVIVPLTAQAPISPTPSAPIATASPVR